MNLNLKKIKQMIFVHMMLWTCIFLLSGQMNVFAAQESNSPAIYQSRTVKGVVTDNSGDPIPGANVVIK